MMAVQADIASGPQLTLQHVLLLYRARGDGLYGIPGGERSAYALVAGAEIDAETGGVQVGPYGPVTMEFVQAMAQGLGVELRREVLPAEILCRTQDVIVWWTKATTRTLFFGEGCKLADLNGEEFPVPALVWRLELKDHRLYLRALAANRRPVDRTALYIAPFLNTYQDGAVCQGTMRRPDRSSLDNLSEWETGFFGAAGSSQLTEKATLHRGQLWQLWRGLKNGKAFPVKTLLKSGQSLAQFVAGGAR